MWSGIKHWFRRHFCTEWQHVGLFERVIRYSHDSWTVYIHCYESQHGDREIEIVGAKEGASCAVEYEEDNFNNKFKISPLYQKELYPWLKGRAHTDIPGFEFVKTKKFDFTRELKGKDRIVLEIDEKA